MPDQNIALGVQVPDAMKSISGMLNFAGQAIDIRKKSETLAADIAQRKAESERADIETRVSRETANPRITTAEQTAQKATTDATKSRWALDSEQAGKGYEIAAGVAQDPAVLAGDPAGSITALMRAEDQMRAHKIPEDKIRVQLAPLYQLAAQKPGELRQALDNIVRGQSGSQTQAGVINSPITPTNTGSQIVGYQTQPGAPGGAGVVSSQPQTRPTTLPLQTPPTQAETAAADALGRPAIQRKDSQGRITFDAPPGANYKPLMALPAGETPQTAASLFQLRDSAQQAAASVPAQRFNNQEILKLADSAFTGTGGDKLAKVLNSFGIQSTNDAGADTTKLQHFISLQVENNAKAQGANTDAARQLAASAVLPGSSPAQAIKAITKINDAYAVGAQLFNKGIQATLRNPNNPKDIFAVRDFQNAWSQNMDPRIFLLANAKKAGDSREVEKLTRELGPDGLRKAENLQRLISQGAVGG